MTSGDDLQVEKAGKYININKLCLFFLAITNKYLLVVCKEL